MNINTEKAEKKGWLFRASSNKLLIPTWKQCWVVVHRHPNPKISIYTDRTECTLEGEANGQCVVDLHKVYISHKPKFSFLAKAFHLHKSKPFAFELVIESSTGNTFKQGEKGKQLIFAANSFQEKERWIGCLMEILNPLSSSKAAAAPEAPKFLIPKGSDLLLPSLSKSQILASSPSAFALHEKIGGIFGLDGMMPFSKKEIASLKAAKLDDSFSLASFEKVLCFQPKRQDFSQVESVSIEELERTWIEFYKCSVNDPLQKQTLLCTALRKYSLFACKAAKELLDGNKFSHEGFDKQFKFGEGIFARFLCVYSSLDSETVAKRTLKAHSFAKNQQIILESLLKNDISVNVFAFVEVNGYILVFSLQPSEAKKGVQMDDSAYISSISSALCLKMQKEWTVFNYNLEGKLMCHVEFDDNSMTNDDEVFPFASEKINLIQRKFDNLELIPSAAACSSEFAQISLNEMLQVAEKSEFFHSKHFCFIQLVGFALSCVIREHSRRAFAESGMEFDYREIVCFILNSLTDVSFFTCILRSKFNTLFQKPSLFAEVLVHFQNDSDKQLLALAASNFLGIEMSNSCNFKVNLPISPEELILPSFLVQGIEIGRFSSEAKKNFYSAIASKSPGKKLVKDDFASEMLLELANKENEFSYEQRTVLVSLATFFCCSKNPILEAKCLASYLRFSFHPEAKCSSSALERIHLKLEPFQGFQSLLGVGILDSIGRTLQQNTFYELALQVYEKCIGICCKFLGRMHPKSIAFQERIADCHMLMENYDQAQSSFDECIRFMQSLADWNGLSRVHLSIAKCLFQKGDIQSALSFTEKSILLLKKILSHDYAASFVEALLFQGKICESQFLTSLPSIRSIVTPKSEYYLNQAEQAYERVLEFFCENSSLFASEINVIVEKLLRIGILLTPPAQKDLLLMAVKRGREEDRRAISEFEKQVIMEESINRGTASLLKELFSLGDERKLFAAFLLSGLEY